MLFHAYHGVLEQEKAEGNTFRVNLSVTLPENQSLHTDCLSDALDYTLLYTIVEREMQTRSNLLEHLAARIRDAVQHSFPCLEHVSVSVAKQCPPVGGNVEWAEVEL